MLCTVSRQQPPLPLSLIFVCSRRYSSSPHGGEYEDDAAMLGVAVSNTETSVNLYEIYVGNSSIRRYQREQ
jgi:hypothetical protein